MEHDVSRATDLILNAVTPGCYLTLHKFSCIQFSFLYFDSDDVCKKCWLTGCHSCTKPDHLCWRRISANLLPTCKVLNLNFARKVTTLPVKCAIWVAKAFDTDYYVEKGGHDSIDKDTPLKG